MGAPKMKPRDSMPTTTSTSRVPMRSMSPSTAALNDSPSLRSVVMSLKRIPGLGKSGMSRMREARSFSVTATRGRLIDVRVGEQSLDAMRLPVGDDDAHVRVRRGAAVELRQEPEEVAHEDPRDAAVADD